MLQRDLATPEPDVPAPAQPDLTPAQIQDAIRFNSQRYDASNTRLIQDLLGGPVTGRWTAANVEAIASTQETYSLSKDGKVGGDTFRFRVQDLSTFFAHIPGGLPTGMTEDSNPPTCAACNYGHRDRPGQARTTVTCGENRYTDDAGTTDQTNGCRYRGEDFPQITVGGLATGDVVDLLVQFRGEIRRSGP